MSTIIGPIGSIILFLAGGWLAGYYLPASVKLAIGRRLGLIIKLLLIVIGAEFAKTLFLSGHIIRILQYASLFALVTTLLPFSLISLLYREKKLLATQTNKAYYSKPIQECLVALAMLLLGGIIYKISDVLVLQANVVALSQVSYGLLLAIIAIVGIEISTIPINTMRPNKKTLFIPIFVVLFSLIGGSLVGQLLPLPWRYSLVLSSGFGWFSLSGALVSRHLGEFFGAIALMTDLLREIIAIMLIYLLGKRYPSGVIGASAATSLDSTLPMIKQACGTANLPAALFNGLILTIVTPLLLSGLLSWLSQ